MMPDRVRRGLALLLLALLAGCGSRPRAPSLEDDPIYDNPREGFRFPAPEGWKVSARANLEPGPLARERLLVRYHNPGAVLEVSAADLPEGTDLPQHLSGPSHGAKTWKPVGKPESVETSGASGTRQAFRGAVAGRGEMVKEVTWFRRGGRVYFFTGFLAPKDARSREQIRHAVASTIWE